MHHWPLSLSKPAARLVCQTARLVGSGVAVAAAAGGMLTVTATAAWG